MDISFNFMEIGDTTNEKDMMNCGIVIDKTKGGGQSEWIGMFIYNP